MSGTRLFFSLFFRSVFRSSERVVWKVLSPIHPLAHTEVSPQQHQNRKHPRNQWKSHERSKRANTVLTRKMAGIAQKAHKIVRPLSVFAAPNERSANRVPGRAGGRVLSFAQLPHLTTGTASAECRAFLEGSRWK